MIEFKMKGGREIHALLQQLPVQVETKILRQALGRGANIVRDEARQLVRKKSGKLRRAIKSTRDTKNGQIIATVRLKGPHAYVGIFQEYSVAPHLIARTGAGQGRVAVRKAKDGSGAISTGAMKIGGDFVSGIISHPGHAAHPFMRPALDTKATPTWERQARAVAVTSRPPLGVVTPSLLSPNQLQCANLSTPEQQPFSSTNGVSLY